MKMKAGWNAEALTSVGQSAIRGFFNRSMRIFEAYRDGLQYEEFKNRLYNAHYRIEAKSKWLAFNAKLCQDHSHAITRTY